MHRRLFASLIHAIVWLPLVFFLLPFAAQANEPVRPCRIEVVDNDTGLPVPLVELKSTNQVRFVSDNAGVIAMDDPTLMHRQVWFHVIGHGYGVDPDGFGMRGIRLNLRPGDRIQVKVKRYSLATRIGRLTGTGLFAESQKLGEFLDWRDGPVFGCDSIQMARYQNKLFWAWGDTQIASYPLGIFHMTGATTSLRPFASFEPPLQPRLDYFVDADDRPRAIANMPGDGPTWLTGFVTLPDADRRDRLVAYYRKISSPLDTYEAGLCVWNDATENFEHLKTVWRKSDGTAAPTLNADGHPAFWTDANNQRWLLFGNPLPRIRIPATFEAWQDLSQWEKLEPQASIRSVADGSDVQPHSGSIAWNAYRKKWVTVFMQKFGKPSAFGTLWYAEADSPLGPWKSAVEILSHENYTFYNPRLHAEWTPPDSRYLLFEGTYTSTFADHPEKTPRYDYNQMLYRLDLGDKRLTDPQASAQ